MKKVYEKPQVYMERFELSQNIALCDYQLGSTSIKVCNIKNDRFPDDCENFTGAFISEPVCSRTNCSIYCYTGSGDGMPSIFMS